MKIMIIGPAKSRHLVRWANRVLHSDQSIEIKIYDINFNLTPPKNFFMRFFISSAINDLRDEQENIYNERLLVLRRILISPLQIFIELILNFVLISYSIFCFKPNLIHVHWLNSIGSFVAVFLAKQFKIPVMITAWGSDINDLMNNKSNHFRNYLVTYQLKNSNRITCDAKHLKNSMIALGAQENKIEIINFGVDTNYFRSNSSKNILRKSLGLDTNCTWILSNRPFEDVYDIETIVKAFFEIQKQNDDIRLILVGKGSKEFKIKELICSLDLVNKIVLKQSLNDTEFLNAIQLTDYYISAAKSDGGIASSVAEAMACEIICFVTNFGENGDWVVPGETGFLFDIGDFLNLSKQMIEVINSHESFSNIGKQARDKIVLDLNIFVETKKIIDSYNYLCRLNS